MAVPKSLSSGRSHRPASTASPSSQASSKKSAQAKENARADDTKRSSSKQDADSARDREWEDAKAKAWANAKKEASHALGAAAVRRIPIIRGHEEERPAAPNPVHKASVGAKPAHKAPAGQAARAEGKADGVQQKRSNPLPPRPPEVKPSNTASAGQRNRSEGMADGVQQKRSNPLPPALPGLQNPIAPYIHRGGSPGMTTPSVRVASPLDPFIKGAANSPMTPTASQRPLAPIPSQQPSGAPAGDPPASQKGVGDRFADLWEIGEARWNGFANGVSSATGGAVNWIRETGAEVVTGVTSGEYKDAAIREYQATNQEFIKNPVQASQQAKMDMVGGLGSAAWDAGQGMVWLGAQAIATGVEGVKLLGRAVNGGSYVLSGEYVFEIGSETAWGKANQIVSDYGGGAKQWLQTYSAEHWGMRTGQGGTEKSIFFTGGEVTGNVASVAVPVAGVASKMGLFGRAAAAGDDLVRAGAGAANKVAGSARSAAAAGLDDAARTAAAPARSAAPGSVAQAADETAKIEMTLVRRVQPRDPPGMKEVRVLFEYDAFPRGRGPLSGAVRKKRLELTARNELRHATQAERARALAELPSSGAPRSVVGRAQANAKDWTTRLNARTEEIRRPRIAAQAAKAERKAQAAARREALAEAALRGERGRMRLYVARGRDDLGKAADAVFRKGPAKAKRLLEVATAPMSRGLDKCVAAVRTGGRKIAERATNVSRRHPVLNEVRLSTRELFRQGGRHHTLRDEFGRALKLRLNEPGLQAVRNGAQTVVDLVGAGFSWTSALVEPVTGPLLAAINGGLKLIGKGSWIAAKSTPAYLSVEAALGHVELRNDPSALTRANLSTDPEHAMFVQAYTLGTTQEALIPASLSFFHSGPTVKGYNPTTGAIELDKAVPSTFVRPGPDKNAQFASNLSWRASLGVAGLSWKLGPDLANYNGNAHVAFATLGASARLEAGNILRERGFNLGTRAYAALGTMVRYSFESNFDYPPLNLPGGFFDGRVIYDATRPKIFDDYWFGGGHDSILESVITGQTAPLGVSGVLKMQDGRPKGGYLGRSVVQNGGLVWWGGTGGKDPSGYGIVFGRNPEALKSTQALKATSPSLYSMPSPFGGPLFKQVEQYGASGGEPPSVVASGGGTRWEPRTQADRVEEGLARAERTPGPAVPWRGPVRRSRTQADRVEDQLREAERVRGPSPPARQIDLEPAPVVNPGVADHFVVSPRKGVNARSAAGSDAPEIGAFRPGEPLQQTGPAQVADGTWWVPVVGQDAASGKTVAGFVAEELLAPQPASDQGATGPTDASLRRRGYTAVEVQPGDTVRDICRRHGLSEDEIRNVVVLNRDHAVIDRDLIYAGYVVYLPPRHED